MDPHESSGASRLFVSYDHKFVIKVIDSEAVAELHAILKQYHEYVVERHGKTLLPQFLGLYRVTVDNSDTYLLVMRNIFGGKYAIHKKYDLKGSTVQRQASEKEKTKELPTLKDNDFLEDNDKLMLPADAKEQLMALLKSDTDFLTKLKLMDYSLLVGIHDVEQGKKEESDALAAQAHSSDPDSGDEAQSLPESPVASVGAFISLTRDLNLDDEFFGIPSSAGKSLFIYQFTAMFSESPKKLIYFIGLVDILTYYGVKKRTASAAKSVKYGSEAENISTVKPDQYARRLLDFVNRNVSSPQNWDDNKRLHAVLPKLFK